MSVSSSFLSVVRRHVVSMTAISGTPAPFTLCLTIPKLNDATVRQVRQFSAKSVKASVKGSGSSANLGYTERKAFEKQKRREAWARKEERLERLKTRRRGKPRDVLKNQFRSWFDPKRAWEAIQDKQAKKMGMVWKIKVAAVVERLPVVTPDKPQWEKDYDELRAYLDSFGKEYPKELGLSDQEDADVYMTDEELLALLPEGFKPAPRETEADKTGEIRTLDRKLKTRVYLAIRGSGLEYNHKNPPSYWAFPTVTAAQDETLIAAAQRAVSEAVGTNLELYCPSNCPMAVDMKVYDPQDRVMNCGYYGEKIFYFRIQRDEGDISADDMTVQDYAWLAREEMVERVKEERGNFASKFYHYLL